MPLFVCWDEMICCLALHNLCKLVGSQYYYVININIILISRVTEPRTRRTRPHHVKVSNRIRIPIFPLKDITANASIRQVQTHNLKPERARNISHGVCSCE